MIQKKTLQFLLGFAAAATPVLAQTPVWDAVNNRYTVVVTDDITAPTTWGDPFNDGVNGSSVPDYILQGDDDLGNPGIVRVRPGQTLLIRAGTIVRGQPQTATNQRDPGSLVVLRGGKLLADGGASNPIVFTTAALNSGGNVLGFTRVGDPATPGSAVAATRYNQGAPALFWDLNPKATPKDPANTGLWGGVAILGISATNRASSGDAIAARASGAPAGAYTYTLPILEGTSSPVYTYGADWTAAEIAAAGFAYTVNQERRIDENDDSGVLRFVSVRHGGSQLLADSELNGVTLAGVGKGTLIDFVEVWGNEDDGIEVFGGSVDMSHLVIWATKDDGLDLDQGYHGNVQFALVVGATAGDTLLEWDGDDGANTKANYEPRGNWTLSHGTFIGGPTVAGTFAAHSGLSGIGFGAVIRNNAACNIYNSIFSNIQAATVVNVSSTLQNTLRHITYQAGKTFTAATPPNFVSNTSTANPGYIAPTFAASVVSPGDTAGMVSPLLINVKPLRAGQGGSAGAVNANLALPTGVDFFESAGYRGAFSPNNAIVNWTAGWSAASASGRVPDL